MTLLLIFFLLNLQLLSFGAHASEVLECNSASNTVNATEFGAAVPIGVFDGEAPHRLTVAQFRELHLAMFGASPLASDSELSHSHTDDDASDEKAKALLTGGSDAHSVFSFCFDADSAVAMVDSDDDGVSGARCSCRNRKPTKGPCTTPNNKICSRFASFFFFFFFSIVFL